MATCDAKVKPGTSPREAPCILESGHTGEHRIAISQWLTDLGSHEIYYAESIGKDFTNWTGEAPCWPIHNAEQTRDAINARGLGGSYEGSSDAAYGYEIARALAAKYAGGFDSPAMGRGTEFRHCLEAIEKAGR